MRFSPNFVEALLLKPLTYFFSNYASDEFRYDEDEKLSKIVIAPISDYHREATQEKPRILADRGPYQIQGVGISDNMAESKSFFDTKGLTHKKNLILISGQAKIIVEARNKGACELVTDMVTHFFAWSKPYICDTQGFKTFGIPMQISPCNPSKEDTEIFQVSIDLPYQMEEMWEVNDDALKLKAFYLTLAAQ